MVYSSINGTVSSIGFDKEFGNYIVISNEKITTKYAHLKAVKVKNGQAISQGEEIGTVGKTGMGTGFGLHFEVQENGNFVNPENHLIMATSL